MKRSKNKLVIVTKEDYDILKSYMDRMPDKDNEMSLAHELSRATIVDKKDFPKHTVKINSKVSILDLETNKVKDFTVVMPEQADMKQNKVSILAPMGTALIGYQKADEISWKMPAGFKRFRILDVVNTF